MKINDHVVDLVDQLGVGQISDIYLNTTYGPLPVSMLTVTFADDQVADRLPHEVVLLDSTRCAQCGELLANDDKAGAGYCSMCEAPSSENTSSQPLPGFEIKSPCGRTWFVAEAVVIRDYADYLMQADGVSLDDAMAQATSDPTWAHTWFNEQFCWEDVSRLGTLVAPASPADIEKALDFYRSYAGRGPGDCGAYRAGDD